MATIPKTKFGHMACMHCGHEVVIKESATGTLSGTCPECDFQHQAKKHDSGYAKFASRIKRISEPAAKPAAKPTPAPAAKPTMAAAPVSMRNTIFG